MPPSPSPPQPSRPPGQPPEYKHFCRVCNKGFTCGSALGGHMRAHGASDVDGFGADDDSLGDEASAQCLGADQWDTVGTSATHAYALRANPNRLIRSCQLCINCGKEFTSWELFLQHGKCISQDEGEEEVDGSGSLRSSSPPSDADGEEDPAVAAAWSKGKRSRRVKAEEPSTVVPLERCTLGEEEDLANCLVMLSSSKSNNERATVTATDHLVPASASIKEGDGEPPLQPQQISFFTHAQESVVALPSPVATVSQYISPASRGVFECKACKKVFTSHQALGGHRASHKKVKGCFAAKFESNASEPARHSVAIDTNNGNGKAAAVDEGNAGESADATRVFATTGVETNVGTSTEATSSLPMALVPIGHNPSAATTLAVAAQCKKKAKMHECSVCHRLFTSGQALGGHKRCHWLTSNTADPCNPVAAGMIPPLTEDLVGVVKHQLSLRPMADVPEPVLDLTIAANPVALAASTARPEASSSSFRLDVAPVHLQPLVVAVTGNVSHPKKAAAMSCHATDAVAEEDEADSTTAKRAKISDLKDVVSMDGEPTEPWLQVGIGSSSAAGDDS
ncbi:unnamed protein product [Miscanthus lutarioriparius]|uniref:C2H2-type domain-containing protein n=1 Tax=Miscanthus lutarioriparius TaxID=422564 RepID=A0A811QXC5_9POAL|nr:unnamed protein product [Miscanthus lutarioriparius]